MTDAFPVLVLPKRFEALERQAKTREADISRIVHKVEDATTRVENLLRQVRDGGIGRFEVFLGKSGSGKTTFFSTLTQFFKGVTVEKVPPELPLEEIPEHIRRHLGGPSPTIWFIHDRDNPEITEAKAERFAEALRPLFRGDYGQVVLIWPITSEDAAKILADAAWKIGRDSLVDVSSRGQYIFNGIDKTQYYNIADLTVRNLTPSESLETFGLTEGKTKGLVAKADTIGEFYSLIEAESQRINQKYRDILKVRPIPRVWIIVAGDSNQDLNMTVSSLTQGRERQVDIDSILSFLDEEDQDRAYMRDWKRRRGEAAFLLRRLDVRVFELPANAALTAVRLYGDDTAKKPLVLKSTAKSSGIDAIRKITLVRAIEGDDNLKRPSTRQTESETADEYRRIQNIAAKGDKRLNKALAAALQECVSEEIGLVVSSEKSLEEGKLKPDICIASPDGDLTCLEITWRTTGKGIDGEISKRQNTLSAGHIQKYLLEKVMEYVNEYSM